MLSKHVLMLAKLGVIALVLLVLFLLQLKLPRQHSKAYDCGIAEISPDYPLEVKEGCRKLRSEKIK